MLMFRGIKREGRPKAAGLPPQKGRDHGKKKLGNCIFLFDLFHCLGRLCLFRGSHKYLMKGQILEVDKQEAYLCIGSAEGAKAGQKFSVFRYVKARGSVEKQSLPGYKRELVGAVKITEVVDEHFAKAIILDGDIKINDVAELNP